MIPMMVLSGAMFSFDKLNRTVGSINKVPLVAEFMVTRWSYEALMVHQYKSNKYATLPGNNSQPSLYDLDKSISMADFRQVYLMPELRKRFDWCVEEIETGKIQKHAGALKVLYNEIKKELSLHPDSTATAKILPLLTPETFTKEASYMLEEFLEKMDNYYSEEFENVFNTQQRVIKYMQEQNDSLYKHLKNSCQNEHLGEIVKKSFENKKILEFEGELVQQIDPIYKDPTTTSLINVRTHFFAPRKYLAGRFWDTYWFNISLIWIYTALLYAMLYFDGLKKLMDFFGRISFKKK